MLWICFWSESACQDFRVSTMEFSRWSVAWICSFIYFLLLGVARLSGLLYLAAIGRYNADRSQAALPFVLCYTVRNVAGPLIGYLGRKVEIRLLTACGCFLSALGAGACFFAEDITTVSVLWGGVFGIGFGLGSILLPEILNQHFDNYISNANGIALGGECVAGFVLPVFVEFLLDTYGTSGTFLILSGLILHGVPAALLLKPPTKTSHDGRVSQHEWVKNRGEYSAVISVSDEGCDRGHIFDEHAIKNSGESLDSRNKTNYQIKAENDNSEVIDHSESYSVTVPLVQSSPSASLLEGFEASKTSTHKPHCRESSIVSETNQSSTSQITTNHCHQCNGTNTSITHFKHNSCSGNYSNSNHPTQIFPENELDDQGSLHFTTSKHRCAIVNQSGEFQSDEASTNHFSHIRHTAHLTPDHNHSYSAVLPHTHSITTSGSPPSIISINNSKESTNHSKESTNHPKESTNHPKESVNNPKASTNHLKASTNNPKASTNNPKTSTNNFKESTNISVESTNNPTEPTNNPLEPTNNSVESPGHSSSPFSVFLDPTFVLILFTQSSMIFIFTTVMTIIVDFSRDAGVKAHQEVYILMCLSVSDMMGRFGLGWVTDGHYMGNVSFSALCYAGTGLLMVSLVFLRGFAMVMVVAFFIGLFLGGLLIVCPGIVLDFIGKDEVTMALASRFALYAPMSLTQSLLIGFFREKMGSYDGLFYVLAVHSFLCCAFSLSIPLASRYRDRRKETQHTCHNINNR